MATKRDTNIPSISFAAPPPQEWREKLVLVMVGLPARGKSYIAHKCVFFLRWLGISARIFNVGSSRRQRATSSVQPSSPPASGLTPLSPPSPLPTPTVPVVPPAPLPPPTPTDAMSANVQSSLALSSAASSVSSQLHNAEFFSPDNAEAKRIREDVAMTVLDELLDWIMSGGQVAFFDATNTTEERRHAVFSRCKARHEHLNIIFVESICDDPDVLRENLIAKAKNSPDYRNMNMTAAMADLQQRIRNYERVYEPLPERSTLSYIKLIDLQSRVIANRIEGVLARKIVTFLMSLHIGKRPIYLMAAGDTCLPSDDRNMQRRTAVADAINSLLRAENMNGQPVGFTPALVPYLTEKDARLSLTGHAFASSVGRFMAHIQAKALAARASRAASVSSSTTSSPLRSAGGGGGGGGGGPSSPPAIFSSSCPIPSSHPPHQQLLHPNQLILASSFGNNSGPGLSRSGSDGGIGSGIAIGIPGGSSGLSRDICSDANSVHSHSSSSSVGSADNSSAPVLLQSSSAATSTTAANTQTTGASAHHPPSTISSAQTARAWREQSFDEALIALGASLYERDDEADDMTRLYLYSSTAPSALETALRVCASKRPSSSPKHATPSPSTASASVSNAAVTRTMPPARTHLLSPPSVTAVAASGESHQPISSVLRHVEPPPSVHVVYGVPRQTSALNEIDTGSLDHMPTQQLLERLPAEFKSWLHNPFSYRFPGGESISNVSNNLKQLVLELECNRNPSLVVSHGMTLEILYAYFAGVNDISQPRLSSIQPYTLVELTPSNYGWRERRYTFDAKHSELVLVPSAHADLHASHSAYS
eukprot:gnl/Spiro4/14095_TR7568_c1_g1_i1.p1 gnl/Spiro4/14095_TR7568_c1_g1~~gnl/Spiro4/14095_TR7568_c1_g1_i1.p1  ORF type:complete len:822 (-),score=141.06 gnl/Spiro4/14095_TR7568_c1_g1_i1:59-2524(-)